MINILLNASVTGGIVILLWYLSYPLSQKYFKASWHYAVLKITMVFMLIPISVLAPAFSNVLTGLFSQPEIPDISGQIQRISIDAETINSVNSALSNFVFPEVQPSQPLSQPENIVEQLESINNTDNVEDDTKTTIPDIPYLQIIWLIVAVLLIAGGIRKMHRFKKQILNNSSSSVDSETQELFLQCKTQLGVRGRITLRTSGYIRTPVVFGLMKPFVIFPETGMSTHEKRLAFTHELTHIKNGDLWLKFIASVISSVHWFNPLAHLLSRKISVISEEYCDECVIKAMTKEERLLYGSLILKVFSDMVASKLQLSKFCSTLSAPTKNIKRRLSNMMNFKKSRKSMIVLSLIAALALCSLATVYAFAANANEKNSHNNIDLFPKDTSNNNVQKENVSIDENSIFISVPSVEKGMAICVGNITINSKYDLIIDVASETGNGLFIALSKDKEDTMALSREWHFWFGEAEKKVNCIEEIEPENDGDYYIFVGSLGKPITNVTGTITQVPADTKNPINDKRGEGEQIAESAIYNVEQENEIENNKKAEIFIPVGTKYSVTDWDTTVTENRWNVSFKQLNGNVASELIIENGSPHSIKFSSSIDKGKLILQIKQNEKIMEVPLGEQTVLLDSFDDGSIVINIIANDAKNGKINVELE